MGFRRQRETCPESGPRTWNPILYHSLSFLGFPQVQKIIHFQRFSCSSPPLHSGPPSTQISSDRMLSLCRTLHSSLAHSVICIPLFTLQSISVLHHFCIFSKAIVVTCRFIPMGTYRKWDSQGKFLRNVDTRGLELIFAEHLLCTNHGFLQVTLCNPCSIFVLSTLVLLIKKMRVSTMEWYPKVPKQFQ